MTSRRLTALAVAVLTAASLTACSSIEDKIAETVIEKAVEAGGDGKVDIDLGEDGEGQVTVDTGDGSVTIGGADLPQGWPADIQVIGSEGSATSVTYMVVPGSA